LHSHPNSPNQNFKWAFFINLAFSIIEVVGGFLFGSIAILTDALHDFSDSLSLGIGWYFQVLSGKRQTEDYSYGYRRFSLLGAIINGTILIIGSLFFIYHSILRFINPGEPMALGMIGLSVVGIGFNYWAYWKMHGGKSLNEQVVSLHLLEDVLGWVAVLVGGGLIYFFNWVWVDPLLSLSISLFIGYKAVIRLKNCIHLMLQGVPGEIKIKELIKDCETIDEVERIHDIHIWSMDGELNVLTIHLSVKQEITLEEQHKLKEKIKAKMKEKDIQHVTIEIEKVEFMKDHSFLH